MSVIEVILQALIQGFTEFLPVSSSGHLSLFQHFTGNSGESGVIMTLILHLGTLLAVFVVFRQTIWALIKEFLLMIKDIFTGKFRIKELNPDRRFIIMVIVSILPLFAFYAFKDFFTSLSADDDIIVEGCAFIYTSILLFFADKCVSGHKSSGDVKFPVAFTIGIFQGIALVPGISRSGSTISSALFCGLKRDSAVEYSFILGIPVIAAGSLLSLKDISSETLNQIEILPLVIGFIVSAIAGVLAIKLIKWLVEKNRFKIFSFYTLILGVATIAVGVCEKIYNFRFILEM